jgi:hypothetical protein
MPEAHPAGKGTGVMHKRLAIAGAHATGLRNVQGGAVLAGVGRPVPLPRGEDRGGGGVGGGNFYHYHKGGVHAREGGQESTHEVWPGWPWQHDPT